MRKGTYKCKNDLTILAKKTVTYEDRSIKLLGPHIYTFIETFKSEASHPNFKNFVRNFLIHWIL